MRNKLLFGAILLLTISQAVIAILGALLPGFTVTVLSIDVEDASFVMLAPASIGMIAGSILIGQKGAAIKKYINGSRGMMLSGAILVLLPLLSSVTRFYDVVRFSIVVLLCLLLGFINAMIIVPASTMLQAKSTEAMRGRLYGVFSALSALITLIPVLLAGYLSDLFGVGGVLGALGAAILGFGILMRIGRLDA